MPSWSNNNSSSIKPCGRGKLPLLLWLMVCATLPGCSRVFWRNHADFDTYRLLEQKASDPRWNVPRLDVQPDPRSRFFDPYDPDYEPLPPDDPAANEYMHEVAGIRGSKSWHKIGEAMSIENPLWLESFGIGPECLNEEGEIVGPVPEIKTISLAESLELANINSRMYQTEIEDLYLAALALTFERFQFDLRFLGLGAREPTSDLTYTSVRDGENSLAHDKRAGISKLLPTGGQWIIELANNTIWFFQGRNTTSTASVISYSLVQPLLMGAGRKVVLENLTQSERNVLYQTRDLARFRKQFFTDIVGGQSGGFLGLLQQRQSTINRKNNVEQLEEQLELQRVLEQAGPSELSEALESLPPGFEIPESLSDLLRYNSELKRLYWRGAMTAEQENELSQLSNDPAYQTTVRELASLVRNETKTIDVLQLETQLSSSRNALRSAEVGFQNQLDSFKILLGLPTSMELSIDDSMLKQFELIDPKLRAIEVTIGEFIDEWAQLDEDDPSLEQLQSVARGLMRLTEELQRDGFDVVDEDIRRVDELIETWNDDDSQSSDRERLLQDVARDRRLLSSVQGIFSSVQNALAAISKEVKQIDAFTGNDQVTGDDRRDLRERMGAVREKLLKVAQGLQVVQVGERVELIELQPFRMSMTESVQNGLVNRLDLKNIRAETMDWRRRVEVAANNLEAVLDIRAEGDIRTPVGRHPFEFRGDESSFRVGLQFTAPLDQIAERNEYRAALISYQRARRDYMAFKDGVEQEIQRSWRNLRLAARNFETVKRGLRSAALQLDSTIETASSPTQRQGNRPVGLDILNALGEVLSQQQQLINNWVQYESNRLNIHRDMGIMEIDSQGIWIDEFYQQQAEAQTVDADGPQQFDGPAPIGLPKPEASHFTTGRERAAWGPSQQPSYADRGPDGPEFFLSPIPAPTTQEPQRADVGRRPGRGWRSRLLERPRSAARN